jgi:serine protease AprX
MLRQFAACGFLLVAALGLALLPPQSAAGPQPQQASVHPLVWETLEAEGQAEVLVVLRAQADLSGANALPTKEAKGRYVYEALRAVAEKTQGDLRASLEAQGIEYQSFYLVNAIRVRTNSLQMRSLAVRPDVGRIVPNPWVRGIPSLIAGLDVLPGTSHDAWLGSALNPDLESNLGLEPNLVRVNADDVWGLGYTGQGVVVAGADTGYEWDHPALRVQYRGWDGKAVTHDYNWHDAIQSDGGLCGPASPEPCDDHGHGTHTMGTILGDDGASVRDGSHENGSHEARRNQIGMAPSARWIGCRNMNVGHGTPATYIDCFEFFLAPYPVGGTPDQGDPVLAPHVVNNSWSCPASEGCDASTLEAAVEALRKAGIVVVASATNRGPHCSTISDPPALYKQSFTVGAFDLSTDQVAGFSARGSVTYDGKSYIKPDIAAPGVNVRSCVPDDGYGYSSGTSMAAPHVTGAVALLLSAAPSFSGEVDAIEQTLTRTAQPRADGQCGDPRTPNNVWGWGALDALAAVKSATAGSLQGRVTDQASGQGIQGTKVTAEHHASPGAGSEATSAPTGHYSMTLPAGSFKVTVRADGYILQTVTNVAVSSGQVATVDFALMPAYRLYLPVVYSVDKAAAPSGLDAGSLQECRENAR